MGRIRICVVGCFFILLLQSGCGMETEQNTDSNNNEQSENEIVSVSAETVNNSMISSVNSEESVSENDGVLPAFYAENTDILQIQQNFDIKSFYTTECYTASNHFYIDGNGILWGTGSNEYGQLGTGSYGISEYYGESVKIAEDVVAVDASWNGYFCIYLTEEGTLYGVGLNYGGLLLGEDSEAVVYSANDYQKVTEPVLLMENVAYAKAGRECIVVLKEDKTAYWWGQYAPLTHTEVPPDIFLYWSLESGSLNPVKMYVATPMLIMENCRYITTGTFTGAAINEDGELYTWGFNIFGECGTEITDDDFVRQPIKVMEDVSMVWVEVISFCNNREASDFARQTFYYPFNTFVLSNDGSLWAAGENLGVQEKLTKINGDMEVTEVHVFSDSFTPVVVTEYCEEQNREVLSQLSFGMTREETEAILKAENLQYFWVQEESNTYLCVEESRYYCYFDTQGYLEGILIQEGGSLDNRFSIGMSLEELEMLVAENNGTLEKVEEGPPDRYIYQDQAMHREYEFYIYENVISVLWERRL